MWDNGELLLSRDHELFWAEPKDCRGFISQTTPENLFIPLLEDHMYTLT